MMPGGYEILEHTADVGIRSWGSSREEAFEQAAWGLADILGIRAGEPGEVRAVQAEATDLEALLVDFLNELLLLHEGEEVGFAAVRVQEASDTAVRAEVEVLPLQGEPEGTAVKAATYHRLEVREDEDGHVETRVYLDV
jgi:SHS2 domain-containing protein